MEMNPVLLAPVLGSCWQCITISSPRTGSTHFLHHLSLETEHYCVNLQGKNTAELFFFPPLHIYIQNTHLSQQNI